MGGGFFSEDTFTHQQATRRANNIDDFAFSQRATDAHPSLNPLRINDKIHGVLESRDSVEHPESTPIIVTFDITGSNIRNAQVVQQKLPELMAKLATVVGNPQLAIWANDDIKVQGRGAIQVSEFESDNRIDESIRNIWLTGNGGGNGGESYDLLLYAAARKVVTDSFEKRNKKGYMFLYADEHFFPEVRRSEVQTVFGDGLERDIPIKEMVEEVQQKWNVFLMSVSRAGSREYNQYVDLFGQENVFAVEGPNALVDMIVGIVQEYEETYKAVGDAAVLEAAGEISNDRSA